MVRWIAMAGLVLLLPACASVPLGTIVQLASWNPAEADPSEIRAAVRAPNGLGMQPGSPRLAQSAWRDDDDRIEDSIVLVAVTDPGETAQLEPWQKPGFAVRAFRIPEADVGRVATFRDRAKGKKLNHFSLQIEAKGCRKDAFDGPILLTTFLKTGADADYVMLTKETDLSTLPQAKDAPPLPPCSDFALIVN